MLDVASLLPNNATGAELALEHSTARVGSVPVPVRDLWNPDTCPADLLPWLAWALSVDEWDAGWPDTAKRETIRQSVLIHRRKGTLAAVQAAVSAAGLGNAQVIEGFGTKFHDGLSLHDQTIDHSSSDHWAEYRVLLDRPVSNAQADQVRSILSKIAPARSHLKQLDFQSVAHLHNAVIDYDGAFNYGAA